MKLRVASYNIRKAVGLDRRCDPERIIAVLHEISADVVALQEADRRFGERISALPKQLIDEHTPYRIVDVAHSPRGMGWHGNALLVRRDMTHIDAGRIALPTIEPRGAVRADFACSDGGMQRRVRVIGMHLDISGLRRRQQVRAVVAHCTACSPLPTILMGDLNEWSQRGGAIREFAAHFRVHSPGASFHARRPVAHLDRIITSPDVHVADCGVHHSALAARASDHLPVWADVILDEPPAR